MWNNYAIEEDWDFGFVEVSTDGGATWTEQKVYNEAGTEVTTPDGYADPNGRMADFGGKKYGLTGDTDGWEHHYVDLTAFAGQTVQVRLAVGDRRGLRRARLVRRRLLGHQRRQRRCGPTTSRRNNGWTAVAPRCTAHRSARAGSSTRHDSQAQYYLVEWRNFDGFDEGLQYAYDTTYQTPGRPVEGREDQVQRPGALVWYRDTSYGNANHVAQQPHVAAE